MESTIILHWGDSNRTPYERFVTTHMEDIFHYEWLNTEFAKFCVESIDNCELVSDHLIISPVLGPIDPLRLSGGVLTLIVAYNNKDKAYPLRNLGDNCAEALYRSGIGSPTQWTWKGYDPVWVPEQRIQIAATGEVVFGRDWNDWVINNAPDPVTLVPGIKYAEDYEDDELC